MRLTQQFWKPFRLERSGFATFDLDHGVANLVGAHRVLTGAQPAECLLEQSERLTQ